MAKWNKTCKEFAEVRKMINIGAENREILRKLHEICAEYTCQDWAFAEDFEDLGCEIWDAVDSVVEPEDDEVNYYLSEFYDLCDNARVWLDF